jgi:ribonuclease J
MDWDSVRVLMANYYGIGDVFVRKISNSGFKGILPKLAHAKIKPQDFEGLDQKALVLMRGAMIPALEKIKGIKGAKMVYSQWKGYLNKDSSDARRFKAFINKYDLDLEHVHTSGHATVEALKAFAGAVKAKTLVPIHTFYPKKYSELFCNVKTLKDGECFAI